MTNVPGIAEPAVTKSVRRFALGAVLLLLSATIGVGAVGVTILLQKGSILRPLLIGTSWIYLVSGLVLSLSLIIDLDEVRRPAFGVWLVTLSILLLPVGRQLGGWRTTAGVALSCSALAIVWAADKASERHAA
jgi:hypothetical protein